jgi:hypothetical protein
VPRASMFEGVFTMGLDARIVRGQIITFIACDG